MSDNADGPREKVIELLGEHHKQNDIANDVEYQVMKTLYELRGKYRIEDMATWTGWSKQTIYNKWRRHGFEVNK